MQVMEGILLWAAIAVVAGILGGILAGYKNRGYSTWIAWCFLIPPLVIVLLLLPVNKGERPSAPKLDDLDGNDRHLF